MLKRLPGGPYSTSYVFEILDFITPHIRSLKYVSGGASEHFINHVVESAIWAAGKNTCLLDPPQYYAEPVITESMRPVVLTLKLEFEKVLYRTLSPIVFNRTQGNVLRPTSVIYHRGEVWLCWKTHDLY